MRRPVLTSIVLLVVVATAIGIYAARVPALQGREPIPSPNGYDDFLAAARLLNRGVTPERQGTPEQVAVFVASNQPALERLRVGLSRPSVVPLLTSSNLNAHMDELSGLTVLARLVTGVAEGARSRQEWDRVVSASTEGIDLGIRIARGGVVLDQLTATSAENMARVPLEKSLSDLPAGPARQAAAALHRIDASREPFARVRLYEEDWVRRSASWPQRVAYRLFLRRRMETIFTQHEQKALGTIFATRNLAQNLAARAYTLEKGQAPASPEALVPEYLPAVPTNPVTGKPLKRFYGTALPAYAQIPVE